MPYSHRPPDIIVPDNDKGRFDAAGLRSEGVFVGTCDRFKKDDYPLHNKWSAPLKEVCANRNPLGVRKHNWCFRCQAGFPIWYDADPQSDVLSHDERLGFITGDI